MKATNSIVISECYSRNSSAEKPSALQNSYKAEKTENQVDRQRKMLIEDNTNVSLLMTGGTSFGGLPPGRKTPEDAYPKPAAAGAALTPSTVSYRQESMASTVSKGQGREIPNATDQMNSRPLILECHGLT